MLPAKYTSLDNTKKKKTKILFEKERNFYLTRKEKHAFENLSLLSKRKDTKNKNNNKMACKMV